MTRVAIVWDKEQITDWVWHIFLWLFMASIIGALFLGLSKGFIEVFGG